VIGLTSTAPLVGADRDRREDAYVRLAAGPRARIVLHGGRYRLTADDPVATVFACALGDRSGFCPSTGDLSVLPRGRTFTFVVRAMGIGTLLGDAAIRRYRH
jgi:hypothetical protein